MFADACLHEKQRSTLSDPLAVTQEALNLSTAASQQEPFQSEFQSCGFSRVGIAASLQTQEAYGAADRMVFELHIIIIVVIIIVIIVIIIHIHIVIIAHTIVN